MLMFSKNLRSRKMHQMNIMVMNEPLFLFKDFFQIYWISILASVDHYFFSWRETFYFTILEKVRTLKQSGIIDGNLNFCWVWVFLKWCTMWKWNNFTILTFIREINFRSWKLITLKIWLEWQKEFYNFHTVF